MTSQGLLPPTYIVAPSRANFCRNQNFHGRIPILKEYLVQNTLAGACDVTHRKKALRKQFAKMIYVTFESSALRHYQLMRSKSSSFEL